MQPNKSCIHQLVKERSKSHVPYITTMSRTSSESAKAPLDHLQPLRGRWCDFCATKCSSKWENGNLWPCIRVLFLLLIKFGLLGHILFNICIEKFNFNFLKCLLLYQVSASIPLDHINLINLMILSIVENFKWCHIN